MTDEEIEKIGKNGYMSNFNYQIEKIENGQEAIIKLDITDNLLNPYGIIHGGVIFGLGDSAMGFVAVTTGRKAVTLNSTINYLHPGNGKYLIAKAKMIKNGEKICYLKCDIYNDKDKLIASMDGNYYYIN